MNILIVDDSKTILTRLTNAIESQLGIKVYAAASMKECADLILANKGKFTLALLDYGLPDAPNGEIINFVKKFNIPSILLTGSKFEKDHDVFKNKNLIDYIIKNGSYAIEYSVSVVKRFIANQDIEVLVVDDSKTFAMKMQGLCMQYNLKTIVNYSAKEALETIKKRPNIKLILVDYMMPEMNGLEFTMELRKTYKKDEVAIIALSGMSEKDIVASFLKYGANDFIYKDFSNEEFFARVNNNLEVLELFQYTQDKSKKDYLTGLFNKKYLLNVGSELYDIAKEKKRLFSVILIDIDQFLTINESYGHEVGDVVLQRIADLLLETLNKDTVIARMGADQFCVLLQNRPYAEIYQIFSEVKDIVDNTIFEINDLKLKLSISIGANTDFTHSLGDMIELADEALANAKHKKDKKVIINS